MGSDAFGINRDTIMQIVSQIKEVVDLGVQVAVVVGGEKNLRMLAIWSVAAAASLLAFRYLPENSHVVVGALAGGATGLLWKEKARES